MSNTIKVKLETVDRVTFVGIEDQGSGINKGNRVTTRPNKQKISWKLTGNLAKATFQAMTATPPGFRWITAPPPDVFTAPEISSNGRRLDIQDTHSGMATSGTWNYQLAVNLGGTIYLTQAGTLPTPDPYQGAIGPIGTIRDPVIINREP